MEKHCSKSNTRNKKKQQFWTQRKFLVKHKSENGRQEIEETGNCVYKLCNVLRNVVIFFAPIELSIWFPLIIWRIRRTIPLRRGPRRIKEVLGSCDYQDTTQDESNYFWRQFYHHIPPYYLYTFFLPSTNYFKLNESLFSILFLTSLKITSVTL